jgi:AAA domain/DnaB-like helicase N terminal domain
VDEASTVIRRAARGAGLNAPEDFGPPTDDDVSRLRKPPHSVEAEQSVLGALLIDNSALAQIPDLREADFYKHEHRLIFGAAEGLIGGGTLCDVITVFERLQAAGKALDVGGLPYLNALAQSVPSASGIKRYAEIVAERATLRALIAKADEIATIASNPQGSTAADIVERASTDLRTLTERRKLGSRRVPLLNIGQLEQMAQSVRWLVKHLVPADSVGMVFGASGTFKSFVVLDLALHIVHGLPWMGRRTAQGPVIYIAGEGQAGMWPRVMAWHRARGLSMKDVPFYVVPQALDLSVDAWRVVDAAQAAGVTPALVVVDTLSQTFGGEENSAPEVAAYLRELGTRFRALWGCAVGLVHHTGHTATERPRGSSALRANLDFMLGVFRDDKELMATLTCVKQKDGDLFSDATFALTPYTLGTDEDGDKVTSLVARHLSSAEEVQEAAEAEVKAGRGGKGQLLISLMQNGQREAELRKAFYQDCGLDNEEARRKAYYRARSAAIQSGFLEIAEGYVLTLKPGQK